MEQDLWNIFKKIHEEQGSWHRAIAEVERRILVGARMEKPKSSRQQIANWLKLNRTTLVMKLKKFGIT